MQKIFDDTIIHMLAMYLSLRKIDRTVNWIISIEVVPTQWNKSHDKMVYDWSTYALNNFIHSW